MYSPSDDKPHTLKSLTPQRKHRKLLKDGSGEEVWPESVEKVFVQGLRQYWQSPWATYTQSRGRSRWRNQFLVDYLQKSGIFRTKKQVASHIQVLRNMWKGEPEFYLVAGGEELLLETGMLGLVKVEEGGDMLLDCDENDAPSSHSASPDYSPCGRLSADSLPSPTASLPIDSGASSALLHNDNPSSYPPFHPTIRPSGSHDSFRSAGAPLDSSRPPAFPGPAIPPMRGLYKHASLLSNPPRTSDISPHTSGVSRVKAFCLLADGMTPFSINVDALLASQPRRASLALKMKLCITSVDDICSPPTLHGFAGSVHLSDPWTTSGKCITKVYVGNVCISEEAGTLGISTIQVGQVTAVLPDSSFTRCRWLDASVPTRLTQQIIVDDQTLIYLIYDLDRRNGMPSAELIGFQNCKPTEIIPTPPPQPNFSTIYSCLPSAQSLPFYRQSLSFPLISVDRMRHAATAF